MRGIHNILLNLAADYQKMNRLMAVSTKPNKQKRTSNKSKLKQTKSKPSQYKSSKPMKSKSVSQFRNKSNI